MSWLYVRSTGYFAWVWNTDDGYSSGPGLIISHVGAPTAYAAGYCSHLRSFGG